MWRGYIKRQLDRFFHIGLERAEHPRSIEACREAATFLPRAKQVVDQTMQRVFRQEQVAAIARSIGNVQKEHLPERACWCVLHQRLVTDSFR